MLSNNVGISGTFFHAHKNNTNTGINVKTEMVKDEWSVFTNSSILLPDDTDAPCPTNRKR